MQQPMNANQVQVVVIAQPEAKDKQMRYRNMKTGFARMLIGLGIVQLIIGILCIIFQGVAVGIYVNAISNTYYTSGIDFVGHGFWIGIMFVITGSLGIAGGMKRSRCQVVAFNVMSIISSGFALCLIGIAIPGAILYTYGYYDCNDKYRTTNTNRNSYSDYYNDYYYYYRYCYSQAGIAMEAMMAILGLIEGIVCMFSSVVCCTIGACCCDCGGSCCCPATPIQNQFLMTGQPYPGQQQIIFTTQQQTVPGQQPQMFIPNQPLTYLPNSQQPIFSPNPQQPWSAMHPQQAMVNLDPGQQMVQNNPEQSNPPPFNLQQSSAYTALSHDSKDQRQYTGTRDTIVPPEQTDARLGTTEFYSEMGDYDN